MARANDPVEIGICAGCGNPIYSNDDYYFCDDEMIHAFGVGARGKTCGDHPETVTMSCLCLYLMETRSMDEVAQAIGIEKHKA